MSEFVNYNTRGGESIGRLGEVSRLLALLIRSRSELFALNIGTIDNPSCIILYRNKGEGTTALAFINPDVERERSISQFFEQRGIERLVRGAATRAIIRTLLKDHLPQDYVPQGAGSKPAQVRAYPVPPAARQTSQITTELLRSVFGMTDKSEMQFRYYEITMGK